MTRACVERSPSRELAVVESMLLSNQRVAVKIELLALVRKVYRHEAARLVSLLWEVENAPSVLSSAMETVLDTDPPAGLELVLRRGVTARRVGVRVVAYRILTSIDTPRVTQVLLTALASDESRWGRLQALRSVVAPGRDVAAGPGRLRRPIHTWGRPPARRDLPGAGGRPPGWPS